MRHWMESGGWLQGSLVKEENVLQLLNVIGDTTLIETWKDIALVVASGSCDVANPSDPFVEFSVARYRDDVEGNYSFNKNPRKLHCNLESSMANGFCIELLAHEKFSILKSKIPEGISPDSGKKFTANELFYYVEWLAGRYKRPAFPSEFDTRIDKVWKKKKRKQEASQVTESVMGVYANVYPDAEIEADKEYNVDLLAIVVPGLVKDGEEYAKIEAFMKKYKEVLVKAKMKVGPILILPEDKIALSTFKKYKRFNLDELSHDENHPLPSEYGMS